MNYEEKIKKIEILFEQVYINVNKGEIRWLYSGTGRTLDKIVGSITSSGYRSVWCSGSRIQYHQIIFYADRGYLPRDGRVIDHADMDKLNNSISNLRDVTIAENAHNSLISKANTTGHKGLYYTRDSKWIAHIFRDGRRIFIGSFDTKKDAIEARIDVKSNPANHSKYRKRKTK